MVTEQLCRHVYHLAREIGERNIHRPAALHAAKRYIAQCWWGMGDAVTRQETEEDGVRCANLEITLRGTRRADEIVLVRAHQDTVLCTTGITRRILLISAKTGVRRKMLLIS